MTRRMLPWLLFISAAIGLRADAHPFKVEFHAGACYPAAGSAIAHVQDGVWGRFVQVYCPLDSITLTSDTSGSATISYQAPYVGAVFCTLYGEQAGTNFSFSCGSAMDTTSGLIKSTGTCQPANLPTSTAGQPPFTMYLGCWFDNGPITTANQSFLGQIQVTATP